MRYFRIGQVASITGLSIKAIRYYEAVGLLPPPQRSDGGYRLYSQEDIHRLHLLKRAKQLGFTLREAGELLKLAEVGCCTTVRPGLRALLDAKLRQIDARIRDLKNLRSSLAAYADRLPAAMGQDEAACIPDRCVPAPERPITLFLESVPGSASPPPWEGGVRSKG